MAWIEAHQSLRKHPKTLRAAAVLHCDRHKFVGHLFCLWWWGLDVADLEGRLPSSVTAEVLADAAEWPPVKASQFVTALLDSGFIDLEGETFVLHDWWQYAGRYNAKRAANTDRMRNARAEHVQRTTDARATHVQGLPTYQPPPLQPTNTTSPTNGNRPNLRHALNFTESEVAEIVKEFPTADFNGRWNEWISWIEEEREKRMPKDKIEAFKGWLRRQETTRTK